MREYQEKMLGSKSKMVICNWERRDGKTYAIIEKLKEMQGNVLVISNNYKHIEKGLEQYCKENNFACTINCNETKVIDSKNNKLDVRLYKPDILGSDLDFFRGVKFAYVFFDEYMPSSREITLLYRYSWIKQIYVMVTNDDIEYIDSRIYKESKILNWHEYCLQVGTWSMSQIENLMKEYSEIPKNPSTTMTREKILSMINNITKIREDVLKSRQ